MELEAVSTIRQKADNQTVGQQVLKKGLEEARQVARLVENLPCAPNAPGIGINIDTAA